MATKLKKEVTEAEAIDTKIFTKAELQLISDLLSDYPQNDELEAILRVLKTKILAVIQDRVDSVLKANSNLNSITYVVNNNSMRTGGGIAVDLNPIGSIPAFKFTLCPDKISVNDILPTGLKYNNYSRYNTSRYLINAGRNRVNFVDFDGKIIVLSEAEIHLLLSFFNYHSKAREGDPLGGQIKEATKVTVKR